MDYFKYISMANPKLAKMQFMFCRMSASDSSVRWRSTKPYSHRQGDDPQRVMEQANAHLRPVWYLSALEEGTLGCQKTPSWAGSYHCKKCYDQAVQFKVHAERAWKTSANPSGYSGFPIWIVGVGKPSCLAIRPAKVMRVSCRSENVPTSPIPSYETRNHKVLLWVTWAMFPISQLLRVLPSCVKQWKTKSRKPWLEYMASN